MELVVVDTVTLFAVPARLIVEVDTPPSVCIAELNFALNADQSVVLKRPRFDADAVGRLKVWAVPDDDILKSVPVVLDAKVWVAPVRPFKDITAADSLALKAVQSAPVKSPVVVDVAVPIARVWVFPEDVRVKPLPTEDVANVCVAPVCPLSVTRAADSLLLNTVQSAPVSSPVAVEVAVPILSV